MRTIAILGSTGSIGKQALDVAAAYPEDIKIAALTAHHRKEELFEQVRRFQPLAAGLTSGEVTIPDDVKFCKWYFGKDALRNVVRDIPSSDVLVAVVGMASLSCVLEARKKGKRILLANKETLVAGGHIIMPLCRMDHDNPSLIPVDSEHSAVYQCLQGAQGNRFRRIILTASGGPFRTWTKERMMQAQPSDALKHPKWSMGSKITIDSATMFNKALEIIEAKWLFGAQSHEIRVLIHPESIIHSLVEFEDGVQLAQLGTADMHTPIMYAMQYPKRKPAISGRLKLEDVGTLSFAAPDTERFPAITMAYEVLNLGGMAPCVMNAANEVAVSHYLKGHISFGRIFDTVRHTLDKLSDLSGSDADEILLGDMKARAQAEQYISQN
ncbi:MAG: 1-deoxy-D-xylulose-5-phosphate reductoisomerase [Eubacteriales bacterium]|jgi:1-deoxy-D-xylulose-5-phosphate reductoisomerase|nr:1-deoxy-D-xylulose-5-phosphate reductoisomerase [Eubacteriales bacterium]